MKTLQTVLGTANLTMTAVLALTGAPAVLVLGLGLVGAMSVLAALAARP